MQAIILAAGMGKRLKELTKDNTKCMVKVNGTSLIDRMLHQLDQKNLSRIVLVTGYEGKKLCSYIESLGISTPICYVDNPIYDKTNNIYSLFLASDYLVKEDSLLLESDIIFEDSVLDCLIEDPRDSLALVDKYEPWMDGTCIRLDDKDHIVQFVPGVAFDFNNSSGLFKTVNIYKFSKNFSEQAYVPFLDAYQKVLGKNEYYEQVLRVITSLDSELIQGKRLDHQKWYEIDDVQDLDIAEALFCDDVDEKALKIEDRHGGYWRFPGLLDYCNPINPYYPPQKMKDEIKASFDTLLTEVPSRMNIISLLAGKDFGVRAENIVVGNGTAEIAKSLMVLFNGKTGIIKPTFEEYSDICDKDQAVYYIADNDDCSYSADDIKAFFGDKDIKTLILINPDNPSGNYIPKNELLSLVESFELKNVNVVIDESFADFSEEEDNSLIDQAVINRYTNLYVIKGISVSGGISGLRLAVLATGNMDTIARIKSDVFIWNIDSFAEYYLQIAGKYVKDYKKAHNVFIKERRRFLNELAKVKGIRVIPSQGNYFMIELSEGLRVSDITKRLLDRHYILVKDLSLRLNGKDYMRIAIRNSEDNDTFLGALNDVICREN